MIRMLGCTCHTGDSSCCGGHLGQIGDNSTAATPAESSGLWLAMFMIVGGFAVAGIASGKFGKRQ